VVGLPTSIIFRLFVFPSNLFSRRNLIFFEILIVFIFNGRGRIPGVLCVGVCVEGVSGHPGRPLPCVRCAEGVGRTGVGTTDLQCVKCCQPTNGVVAGWRRGGGCVFGSGWGVVLDQVGPERGQKILLSDVLRLSHCSFCVAHWLPAFLLPDSSLSGHDPGCTHPRCPPTVLAAAGRVPTSWPQLTEQVRTQFMVARAHNMDLPPARPTRRPPPLPFRGGGEGVMPEFHVQNSSRQR